MLVIKIELWPMGREDRKRLWAQGVIDCIGVAKRDDPELGVKKGERAYRVRLLKAPRFKGPKENEVHDVPKSKVWREGFVRGHIPTKPGRGSRGEWDLLGGALKVLLGNRLADYVRGDE